MSSKLLRLVVRDQSPASGSAGAARLAAAAAADPCCGNCRRWKRLGRQWGNCGSKRIKHLVETEGALVTRDAFQCRLHAPGAKAGNQGQRRGNRVSVTASS